MPGEEAAVAGSATQQGLTSYGTAAVQSGSGLIGDIISAYANANQARLNRQFNREEAERARQWQLDQWNRQNEYDLPVNQMRRLKEAGLNPNLIYGQLGTGNVAGSAPQASSSPMALPSVDTGYDILSAKLMEAQIQDLNSQAKNRDRMTEGQVERWKKENDVSDELCSKIRSEVSEIQERTRNLGKEWELMDNDNRLKLYQIQVAQKTWEYEVEKLQNECKISRAEAEYASRLILAKINNIEAQTDLYKSQKDLTDSQKDYLDRTVNDLIRIVKANAGQAESMDSILAFQNNHTNNWEYWINFVLGRLDKNKEFVGDILKAIPK